MLDLLLSGYDSSRHTAKATIIELLYMVKDALPVSASCVELLYMVPDTPTPAKVMSEGSK